MVSIEVLSLCVVFFICGMSVGAAAMAVVLDLFKMHDRLEAMQRAQERKRSQVRSGYDPLWYERNQEFNEN
jgi:hypothetical protein